MSSINDKIQDQYNTKNLFETICQKLEEKGIDLNNVKRSDISGVDEFHVRGAEVSNELAKEIYLADTHVLDLGCGLGGSARMLAEKHNCVVTGIDLNKEYIRTAQQLSELTGLSNRTVFLQTDAQNLPFENAFFDVVWTQHVQMNIQDKTTFYKEINRVLKDEGALVYYDIYKLGEDEINHPVPWANHPSISFLESIKLVDSLLHNLGFEKLQSSDQTLKAKQSLNNSLKKLRKNGLPALGLNLLMGNSTIKKLDNLLKAIEDSKIELQSGIYRKKSNEHENEKIT